MVPACGHLLRDDFGHAEVGDLGGAVLMHHDVGGLDIAMDDAFFVRVIERRGHLPQDAEQRFFVGRLLRLQHFSSAGPLTNSMKMYARPPSSAMS